MTRSTSVMRNFILTIFILHANGLAQDSLIFKKYLSAIRNIQTISYAIQRIDTFADGNVWNHKGQCFMKRESADSVIGYQFIASNSDAQVDNWYDGKKMFWIKHKSKSYVVDRSVDRRIFGSPGGQMVVGDFITGETGYTDLKAYEENGIPVLQYDFPDEPADDITHARKTVYLDAGTYLPRKIVSTLFVLGKQQVTIMTMSDVVNNQSDSSPASRMRAFLDAYTEKTTSRLSKTDLMNKDAPQFGLLSFDGSSVSLKDQLGKMVLLDFWETWCGPCRRSMSKVQALYDKFRGDGLIVYGILGDVDNLDDAKKIISERKVTYVDLVGTREVFESYGVAGIPRFVLIDAKGTVLVDAEGDNGGLERIEAILNERLPLK